MFAICVESSHKKGMGHLFRMLNFAKYLQSIRKNLIFIINDNNKTKDILHKNKFKYKVENFEDFESNWETSLIKRYNFIYWINDRLDTNIKHSENVMQNNIKLITFDDLGKGAKYSNLNICGLSFSKNYFLGKKILKGIDYLILNSEIEEYKKERTELKNILVTLGGSDTHGVTIKVLRLLKKFNIKATIHIGPSFEHLETLQNELNDNYRLIKSVPSLIEEFSKYDLAITGGGITPFEANASGLPCIIIANEAFEIPNAKYLQSIGSSKFLGLYTTIDESIFKNFKKFNIKHMSQNGLSGLNTHAVEKIYKEIILL